MAGHHLVGSAYGVYHLPQRHPGSVDAKTIIVIGETRIVRPVHVEPARPLSESRRPRLGPVALSNSDPSPG
jgi:hypothetical protein